MHTIYFYLKECYTLMLMGNIDLANIKFMKTSFGPYGNFFFEDDALKHEVKHLKLL